MKRQYCDASSQKSHFEQIKEGLEKDIKIAEQSSFQVHM